MTKERARKHRLVASLSTVVQISVPQEANITLDWSVSERTFEIMLLGYKDFFCTPRLIVLTFVALPLSYSLGFIKQFK